MVAGNVKELEAAATVEEKQLLTPSARRFSLAFN
jgi:hypothetical protein